MNKSNDKLIKKSNNNINFLIKLKNEVKIQKISDFSAYFSAYFSVRYFKTIITKKLKQLKTFYCVPVILKKNKKYHIKNLTVDHLELDFEINYYDWDYHISPLTQLTILIHLLKFMNIKKVTLYISIYKQLCPTYELFCKYLRNILQKYCKDIDVVINYYYSSSCFITKLGAGVNFINENYATINKFQVNHHRNYQLKHRIA